MSSSAVNLHILASLCTKEERMGYCVLITILIHHLNLYLNLYMSLGVTQARQMSLDSK